MTHGIPAQKTYLFTDLRHVLCSDLQWLGPDGQVLPLRPTGPPVEPVSATAQMPRGLRFVAQPATKTDPLPPSPYLRSRILYDGGVYRAWGMRGCGPNKFEINCTESRDLFDWRLVRTCTVQSPVTTEGEGFTVFMDPQAPAAERYKAVYCGEPPREQWPALFAEYQRVHRHHRIWRFSEHFVFTMHGLVSPDGLAWSPLPGHLMAQYSDTDTSVYFDEPLGRYVMYTRLMFQQRRWIGRAESEDFRHWGPVQPLIAPQLDWPMTDDVYLNGFSFYPGEPAYYLMFPMIYHRWNQRSSIHLYTSDDGIAWLKVPGGAVIEPGPSGSFDSEFLGVGKDLVPMGTDRIALPYMGTKFPHKYPRWPHVLDAPTYAWAWWPRGRLCALRADNEGSFVTFPLEVAGRTLRVNARVDRGGELRVGIVDQPGRSVDDCDPITGDSLARPVHWRGEETVGIAAGTPVTLEFRLRSTDLFGCEWD